MPKGTRSRGFACLIVIFSGAIAGLCGELHPAHAWEPQIVQAELATADTAIAVEAGEHAPRLTTLRARGAPAWKNSAEESLPERIEIHGETRAVAWQLDRSASRLDAGQIQLVYVSDSPQLRLVWQWQARAGFGPVEHSILIQNLSGESVWLPLQPSFRFDWQIDPQTALERFWVEKGADIPSSEGTHLDALHDGDSWQGTSSTYARPHPGQPREMIPLLAGR